MQFKIPIIFLLIVVINSIVYFKGHFKRSEISNLAPFYLEAIFSKTV